MRKIIASLVLVAAALGGGALTLANGPAQAADEGTHQTPPASVPGDAAATDEGDGIAMEIVPEGGDTSAHQGGDQGADPGDQQPAASSSVTDDGGDEEPGDAIGWVVTPE